MPWHKLNAAVPMMSDSIHNHLGILSSTHDKRTTTRVSSRIPNVQLHAATHYIPKGVK
jgi:hypothetical protein